MNYTPENITKLEPWEIFVMGTNLAGRHGAGAALLAWKKFGAVAGQGYGPMGQSYGIPTKDRRINTLPLETIGRYVAEFLNYAKQHPDQRFLVTQIGCGLAGYSPSQIAPLFQVRDFPENVHLPREFWEVIS